MYYSDYVKHYGVKGMKWGVRKHRTSMNESTFLNNPSRPKHINKNNVFGNNTRFRLSRMSKDAYIEACRCWERFRELDLLPYEREQVIENFDNNLTDEEKEQPIVSDEYGDYVYTAVNKGHNTYKIIKKNPINGYDDDDSFYNMVLRKTFEK